MVTLNAIDLFMGAGGSSVGINRAGYKIVGALDFDENACQVYKKHFSIDPIQGDINDYHGEDILDYYGLEKNSVDLLVGCPPCQGFSSLRRTRYPSMEDDRKGLVDIFSDRVKEINPRTVIFENVPGILYKSNKLYFDDFLNNMSALGYSYCWGLVNAADYGVPQFRKRERKQRR